MSSVRSVSECPSCGGVEFETDDSLNVCTNCGTLVDTYTTLVADKSGYLTFAPDSSNTRLTKSKREILRFAEANVSGDSKKQIIQSVKRIVCKSGVLFRKEAVAAAAAYHVLRSSSSEFLSLKEFSLRFGANLRDIHRVLKSLPPLEPPKEDNYVHYIRDVLQYGEFWDATGSGIDNESMIKRVVHLARLMGRPFLSQEFVLASSIVLYRSEAWNANRVVFKRRLRGSVDDLLGEVGLRHSSLNASKVSLETRNILKKCKELIRKLPYVIGDEGKTRNLKSSEVYYYIDDLFKYSDLLLYSSSSSLSSLSTSSLSTISSMSSISTTTSSNSTVTSTPHESRHKRRCDEIDDKEISSYIRSPKEVEQYKKIRTALMTRI